MFSSLPVQIGWSRCFWRIGMPIPAHSRWDLLLVLLAMLHGAVLCAVPSVWLIALGIWWNSNTVAHYFVHLPFFRGVFWNRCFSAYQSLLLGIPQQLWRDRHLAHHAERTWRVRWSSQLVLEISLVLCFWSAMLALAPRFMLTTYWPGYLLGLLFCHWHGFFEHAQGTTSHYGSTYNRLCFNDGYHVEHHAHPGAHWRSLPSLRASNARESNWPAIVRWIERLNAAGYLRRCGACAVNTALDLVEQLVVHCGWLRRFVMRCHRRAFEKLLVSTDEIRSVGVIGGGLFPRTALILQEVLGGRARIKVIEANQAHIEIARGWTGAEIEYEHATFHAAHPEQFDLLVVPLAYRGSRSELEVNCRANLILMHDWIWHRAEHSTVISYLLLKRLNRYDK